MKLKVIFIPIVQPHLSKFSKPAVRCKICQHFGGENTYTFVCGKSKGKLKIQKEYTPYNVNNKILLQLRWCSGFKVNMSKYGKLT